MSIINRLSFSPVASSLSSLTKYKYTHSEHHVSEFKFKAGSFKLNNVKITLKVGDTLDAIVKKFNDKKLATGVSAKKVYVEGSRSYKIVLLSLRSVVNILDLDGVLLSLYTKKLLGADNKSLLQVIRSEAGKKTSDIVINYTLKLPVEPESDKDKLAEFNKLWLADMKLSGPLLVHRQPAAEEVNEYHVSENSLLEEEVEELNYEDESFLPFFIGSNEEDNILLENKDIKIDSTTVTTPPVVEDSISLEEEVEEQKQPEHNYSESLELYLIQIDTLTNNLTEFEEEFKELTSENEELQDRIYVKESTIVNLTAKIKQQEQELLLTEEDNKNELTQIDIIKQQLEDILDDKLFSDDYELLAIINTENLTKEDVEKLLQKINVQEENLLNKYKNIEYSVFKIKVDLEESQLEYDDLYNKLRDNESELQRNTYNREQVQEEIMKFMAIRNDKKASF